MGAGPAGLVAALTLLQNGIPVRIIDKDPNVHWAPTLVWDSAVPGFGYVIYPLVRLQHDADAENLVSLPRGIQLP